MTDADLCFTRPPSWSRSSARRKVSPPELTVAVLARIEIAT